MGAAATCIGGTGRPKSTVKILLPSSSSSCPYLEGSAAEIESVFREVGEKTKNRLKSLDKSRFEEKNIW